MACLVTLILPDLFSSSALKHVKKKFCISWMRTERVFIVLNQQKPSLWLGTSASCFLQEIFLLEPWSLSTCIIHWLGSFIMRWRYKDLMAPHWIDVCLEGKENRECRIVCYRCSVKVFILLHWTFTKGFRTQSYSAAANMKSQTGIKLTPTITWAFFWHGLGAGWADGSAPGRVVWEGRGSPAAWASAIPSRDRSWPFLT